MEGGGMFLHMKLVSISWASSLMLLVSVFARTHTHTTENGEKTNGGEEGNKRMKRTVSLLRLLLP